MPEGEELILRFEYLAMPKGNKQEEHEHNSRRKGF